MSAPAAAPAFRYRYGWDGPTFATARRDMTILIFLAVAAWLLICVSVVALARMAARGDAANARRAGARFERRAHPRSKSRNPD